MPTGYTADIKDGISFRVFALRCARAFGALITMRDDPSDAPIPGEFKPSDYHDKALSKAEGDLKKFMALTPADHEKEAEKQYAADLKDYDRRRKENDSLKSKYIAMRQQARTWNPPSPDHQGLKDFMIQQIEISIDFDCHNPEPPKRLTGQQWAAEKLKDINWNLSYHRDEAAKERERVASRNQWIKQLRESL